MSVRERCHKGESTIDKSSLTGPQGESGTTGPPGEPGSVRLFGNGSAGSLTITSSQSLSSTNLNVTDLLIEAGVVLRIPSGTVIRCTGSFVNRGSIIVERGLGQAQRVGDNGSLITIPSSRGQSAQGGAGGRALPQAAIVSLRPGLFAGGEGARTVNDSGGEGGGSLFIISRGQLRNEGTISANGGNATQSGRGGGAGGFLVFGSEDSILNLGRLEVSGGAGAAFSPSGPEDAGLGPGGGGGGGIVFLISPSVTSSGPAQLSGGSGGGGVGVITALFYTGGWGGGGSGGKGGAGGNVAADGVISAGEAGAEGVLITSTAELTSNF